MHRRRLLSGIAGCLAAGVAGCSAPMGDAGSGVSDVVWLDGDALDADAIAESHAETLVDAGGFELFSTADTDHDGESDPSGWLPSQEYEVAFELDRERQYLRQELTDADGRDVIELFVDGDEGFVREQQADDVTEGRRSVDRTGEEFRTEMREESLSGVRGLDGWPMTVADRAAELDGVSTVRLTADEFVGETDVPEQVSAAEATMHATADGVVPRLEQRWEGRHRGLEATVDIDIAFRAVGETVIEEPDWVAGIREGE